MKSLLAFTCVGFALLSVQPLALAAPVSYAFSVSGAAGNGSGSFQFDDSTGLGGLFGETEYALTGFSFSFGGGTFDLGSLGPDAPLVLFDGTHLLGLEAAERTLAFAFTPSVGGQDPFLATARGTSSISYRLIDDNRVPEPGTAWLGLAAMFGALAFGRRRQGAPMNR